MEYRIEMASIAESEANQAFLSIIQVTSTENAKKWDQGLLKKIESLGTMPKRCPLAPENEYFSQEIRQLLYGKGKNLYRILFTIIESKNPPIVRILHIRHSAQETLGQFD
jgi:plasmid stabilization system protein ParE